MPTAKRELMPQARALYADGLTMEEVAGALGVAPSTVHRWKAADRQAGVEWEDARNETIRKDPRALLNMLERRLQQLAEDETMAAGQYADAIYKLDTVVHRIRERYGDVSMTLAVLGEFAAWAHDNCSDDETLVLLRAHERYLAELKRRHT